MSISFVRWHKHENLEKIADKIHEHIGYNIPVDIDYVIEIAALEIMDINSSEERRWKELRKQN